jgi:hypothetical protein
VPIRLYFGDRVFRPEQTKAMGEAFECVCKELGLKPDVGPDTGIVASLIIGAASAGENDPKKLCAAALNVLQKNSPRR